MKSWVDVLIPGRHAERFRLREGGATVGSGKTADIRITGVPGILPVHCHLRPTALGCEIRIEDEVREPFSYQGRATRACLAAWGQDLYVGSLRLTVGAQDESAAATRNQSPVLWVALIALPLLLAAAFLGPADGPEQSIVQREPPPLFGQLPACSESREGAVGRGLVAEQVALSKHERGVFELADSVNSVELMREAAACYALGENQGASDRALDRAEEWIADLQFTYKRALLDLETGRRTQAGRQVLTAIQRLQVLLGRADANAEPFKQELAQLRLSVVVALEEARRAAAENK